jgi:ABC-type multidrug transport system fused ATPase/permease subunit
MPISPNLKPDSEEDQDDVVFATGASGEVYAIPAAIAEKQLFIASAQAVRGSRDGYLTEEEEGEVQGHQKAGPEEIRHGFDGAHASSQKRKSKKDRVEDVPIPLLGSLKMAWSLRTVYLAAIPSAIGLLLLALVQADLLIGVTFLAQRLLDSFTLGSGGAGSSDPAGVGPMLTGWLTGLFSGPGMGKAPIVGGLIFIALLAESLSLVASQWRFSVSQGFRSRLQRRLVQSMLRASGPARDSLDTAACQTMYSGDSGGLGMFLIFGFLGFFEQLVKLALVTAALVRFPGGQGWMLALILVPSAIFFKVGIMRLFMGWEQRTNHHNSRLMMESQRSALSFFPLMPRLVYLGGENVPADRLQQAAERSAHGNQRLQLVTNLHGSIAAILGILALPLVALVLLRMNTVSPGEVIQIQGLFATIIAMVGALVSFPSQIIQFAPALKRVTDALAVPDPGPRPPEIDQIREVGPVTIEVKGLSFRYGPGLPLQVDDVSFRVPAGKLICIVGKSGSGKSTLARLLMGERLAEEGSIKLGELEVSDWHLWWRREVMAFLPAEVGFFRDTLVENLRFGRGGVPTEAVRDTAEALGLTDALAKYGDEALHAAEMQLSTGEQRRVGVGRLLLGGQRVWIMDEPLANLDPSMMGQVAAAISAAARGRTTIIITHDPEFFESEFNVFLRNNRVDEIGTHDRLMAMNSHYRALCERPSVRPVMA